jgi:hypothetical protein
MKKRIANFFKSIGKFFTSGIGLLLLGFILTTGCGGLINWMYTSSSWDRDKRFELLKNSLQKHEELLSDLTKIVGTRTFRLQRVVWGMDPPDATPTAESWELNEDERKELKARWTEYYQAVTDWNTSYRTYAIKIRVLAGDEIADKFFMGDASGARLSKPGTLCWNFEQSHGVVAELRKAALTGPIDQKKHDLAQQKVNELYNQVDDFVARLYRALADKEHSDDPLKPVHH